MKITDPILVDTGPLVALIREADQSHQICGAQSRNIHGRRVTCWPVLTDAALIYLAERENINTIFTLDRRDFSVYRLNDNRSLKILPDI